MNLTSTQQELLAAAARHPDLIVAVPPSIRGAAKHRVVSPLLQAHLVEEVEAEGEIPVWRAGEGKRYALRLVRPGSPDVFDSAISSTIEDGLSILDPSVLHHSAAIPAGRAKKVIGAQSTRSKIIRLLLSSDGITIAALSEQTGLQPHSIRSVFSRLIRHKLGLTLSFRIVNGQRKYRIADATPFPSK